MDQRHLILFQRIFILGQSGIIAWHGHIEALRQAAIQKARPFEIVQSGQITDRLKSEMGQKLAGRAIRDGTTRRFAATPHFDPARFHQHVNRAAMDRHTPNIFDFSPRNRLVIGNHRQRFQCGPRQFTGLLRFTRQQKAEIFSGMKIPAIGRFGGHNTTPAIIGNQFGKNRLQIDPFGQARSQFVFGQRLGRGK